MCNSNKKGTFEKVQWNIVNKVFTIDLQRTDELID